VFGDQTVGDVLKNFDDSYPLALVTFIPPSATSSSSSRSSVLYKTCLLYPSCHCEKEGGRLWPPPSQTIPVSSHIFPYLPISSHLFPYPDRILSVSFRWDG
jgi:hypothetical protein